MNDVKKSVWIVICVWCLLAVGGESLGQTNTTPEDQQIFRPAFRPGEVIVKIQDELPSVSRSMKTDIRNTESANLNRLNETFGVTQVTPVFQAKTGRAFVQSSPLNNVLLLKLGQDVEEKTAVRAYNSLEEVEYAEPNYFYYIFAMPNDAFFSSQYGLYNSSNQGIDAIGGWDVEQGDSSVIIAIIDTGIDSTHEDLSGKVIQGYDFVNEDYDPRDDNGHGTHVAGIAAAKWNNGRGIAGVCPGCSLLAVKVVTADGSGANSWIANGIANAVNLGARVINLSLGGLDRSSTIQLAVQQAYQRGAVVVAASGNDGSGVPLYPAAFEEAIAVGATDRYGDRASFSSYGSHLELAAPGQAIYSTLPGNSYGAWNGTSMACPHVAGLAGLLLSRNPALSNAQIRQILISTSQDLGASGRDSYFGYGRINALRALSQAPDDTGNYPTPKPQPNPYPTPGAGSSSCGQGVDWVFGAAVLGLGWVNIERRRKKHV